MRGVTDAGQRQGLDPSGQATPGGVLADWLSDPPHRANVLGAQYRDVGFGLAHDTSGAPYWCADYGWRAGT